jgi:hypothetical protein
MGKAMSRQFTEEEIQMANMHVKHSASLVTREVQT